VIGGGAIGVGRRSACKAQGVEDVTLVEPNAIRRSYLETTRPDVRAPEDVAGLQFDLVVDGSAIDATRAAASAAAHPGGVIVHIGLGGAEGGLDIRRMTLQEITFIGTYTYTAQDFRDTCAGDVRRPPRPLDWTETRPLSEGASAFEDIRAGASPRPRSFSNHKPT
jgi:L-gulonate 5-dehydrogenase